ncbi:DUF4190 domain-containing protein [Streptomyces sp. enrichment culture]|uniref:DUF4190 domain-containing protein n=1 Tax=Streptomyces sp. enrichment culture TaxID=1795815 RepID=UPI003F56EEB4
MQLTAPATRTDRTDTQNTTDRTDTQETGVRKTGIRDTDGMAVASFVLGLLGLLVLNVFLGPVAIVLAAVALWRGTARRGRALLGLGLGVADLLVLVAFMSADSTVSWSL